MDLKNVIYSEEDKIGYLTLNRPASRNSLSKELLLEMTMVLQETAREGRVNVVIIRGAGGVFSAGHDLKEMAEANLKEAASVLEACTMAMRAIREMPQPVIAQVKGVATAAGCQLVAACDLAVASSDSRFATPGTKIGLFCTTPAVFLSRNVGRKKALEMLFTGDFISAGEALASGLVNRVVPPEELDEAARELALTIAGYSLETLGIGKRAFYQQVNMEDFMAFNYAAGVILLNLTSENAREGMSAFLEKRRPVWK